MCERGIRRVRTGELHALENDGRLLVAQRLAGDDVLEAGHGDDVTRARDLDVLAVVGVHHQQTPDALLLALVRAQRVRSRLKNPAAAQGESFLVILTKRH